MGLEGWQEQLPALCQKGRGLERAIFRVPGRGCPMLAEGRRGGRNGARRTMVVLWRGNDRRGNPFGIGLDWGRGANVVGGGSSLPDLKAFVLLVPSGWGSERGEAGYASIRPPRTHLPYSLVCHLIFAAKRSIALTPAKTPPSKSVA